jgi:ParB-like chromosome segregation protein Spo0J
MPDRSTLALTDLTRDLKNARTHDARNLATIAQSLTDVGAARSIVIDEDGVILAGNGTAAAAAQAGLTRVRVVEAAGDELIAVRRSNLTPEQKIRLALADNRTSELAGWDTKVLAELQAEVGDLSALWSEDELNALLGLATASDETPAATLTESYQVLVTCAGETDQGALLARLSEEGYRCRALIA